MANEEHLQIIRRGVDAWNEWRQKNPNVWSPDLSGANLGGANLSEANLFGADLSGANLSGAKLRGANLDGANLIRANLHFQETDLTGASLSMASLGGANLQGATLRGATFHKVYFGDANLLEADLDEANLVESCLAKACLIRAYLRRANLSRTDLREANLFGAVLSAANLSGANLRGANLSEAYLGGADLTGANLTEVNLREAKLGGADLSGASLIETLLIGTDFCSASLAGSSVYGASVWDIKVNDQTKQQNLVISPPGEAAITVDNIKVAQFIYLLLNNKEIRDAIDTITSKAVLILGRFSDERKPILDAIRDELRKPEHNYLPIVFDFQPSTNQTKIETIKTLANMARFVIADLTDARSVLQELQAIVPGHPSVAVRLLIKKSAHEYGMLDFIRAYRSVVENTYEYESLEDVIGSIKENVVAPAEAKVKELRPRG